MAGPVYVARSTPLTDGLAGGGTLTAPPQRIPATPRSAGLIIPALGEIGQPRVKVESLVDDFTTLDPAVWVVSGTASVSSGQLNLTPATSYGNKIDSVGKFDLMGSSVTVQVVTAPAGNGTIGTFLILYPLEAGHEVSMVVEGGQITMAEKTPGTDSTSVTYDPVAHLWWRIRHDGTLLLWETSPDASTWTVQRSKVPARSWDTMTVLLMAGYFGTEPTPGTVVVDNLNVSLATAAPADVATGSATAADAQADVQASASAAAGTGAAQPPVADAQPQAGSAAAAGTAADAALSSTANAGLASAAGVAATAQAALSAAAGAAGGSGVAADARVAHTYYVDPAGSDAADGYSTGTAWASITKVNAAALGAGDSVLFARGGTWTGTALTVSGSGHEGTPLLVGSYGSGALPIFDGGGTNTTVGTVNCIIVTGSYVTVENVQVQHALSDGLQIQGDNFEGRGFTARNNPIGVNTFPGQTIASIHDFQCIDNNIEIVQPGADDDYGAMGMSLSGDQAEIYGFLISGSLTFSSPDYGTDGSAIEIFGGTNTLIRDGVAVDCETFSELGNAATDNITYRNIDYQSSFVDSNGFVLQGSDGAFGPVTNIVIENCSIRLSGANGHGLIVAADATCQFKNNIVEAAYLGFTADPQDEERNVWFGGANGSDVLSTHHATQSGLAPTDVVADPLWVSPASGDLHLGNGSPAIDIGVPVAWLTDLDGLPRTVGVAPDAGAYEWQGIVTSDVTGVGTAGDPAVSIAATAGQAAGTGAAQAPTVAADIAAGVATATAAGHDATAAATAAPVQASAAGTAADATVTTDTQTNAAATEATAAGVAQDVATAFTVLATEATATAVGHEATASAAALVTEATAAAAAQSASASVACAAAESTGAGAASTASSAVTIPAAEAIAAGSAADPTVTTDSQTNAPAGEASAIGAAHDTSCAVAAGVAESLATATALDATCAADVGALAATAAAQALDALAATAGQATATVASGAGVAWPASTTGTTSGITYRPVAGVTVRPTTGITLRPVG